MPQYDFQCSECKRVLENQFLRITHLPDELPFCCDQTMNYYITQPPLIHWVDPNIDAFRAIATKDRPIIRSKRENREYMARHDLIDANELGPPPTHEETQKTVADMQASIDAITPTGNMKKELKQQGILDVVE